MEKQLINWMKTFVEVPHPTLGDWPPCPYARHARIDNKIAFIESKFGNLVNTVEQNLVLLDTKDVLVIWFDHNDVDPVTLSGFVRAHNELLMPRDYVILEDHPDALEFVSGVNMNFGKCALLLVQRLSKLNKASDQLQLKGYYQHWDNAAYEEVVSWRYT